MLKSIIQNLNNVAENLINLLPKEKVHHNISKAEDKTLKNLKKDNSILIKEADKGGSVIIINRNYYIQKI